MRSTGAQTDFFLQANSLKEASVIFLQSHNLSCLVEYNLETQEEPKD